MAVDQETLDALAAMLAAKQGVQPQPQAYPGTVMSPQYPQQMMPGQQQMMPGMMPTPTGISFRLKVPLPDGRECPIDLVFGAEAAQNPAMVQAFVQQVVMQWPVEAYQPKQQQWGGGGGGGYGGGQGGGNWNRGGGGGRRW